MISSTTWPILHYWPARCWESPYCHIALRLRCGMRLRIRSWSFLLCRFARLMRCERARGRTWPTCFFSPLPDSVAARLIHRGGTGSSSLASDVAHVMHGPCGGRLMSSRARSGLRERISCAAGSAGLPARGG